MDHFQKKFFLIHCREIDVLVIQAVSINLLIHKFININKAKPLKLLFIKLLVLTCVTACSSAVTIYKERQPGFSMTSFFNGDLCAWGVVRNRSNDVNRKFVASIKATASADSVELDEVFLFDDGERQTRVWQFTKRGNLWVGEAGDVVGEATGEVSGDTLHLTYQLTVKVDDSDYVIAMDDWLHLVDNNTLLGSTDMSKWGLDVGRIDIVIQKQNNQSCIAQ